MDVDRAIPLAVPPGWPPAPVPRWSRRRRLITLAVLVAVLAGLIEVTGVPKIVRWRLASEHHARSLEEAMTSRPATRETTPGSLLTSIAGGIEWGDQEPVTIADGRPPAPTRVATAMATAANVLTGRGYRLEVIPTGAFPWQCEWMSAEPVAPLYTPTAPSYVSCYVRASHGKEHAEIAVTTSLPPPYTQASGESVGEYNAQPNALVTDVRVAVKD